MNGATALPCENTISSPSSTNTMMIGASQYFFSAFRNWPNSLSTRNFDMRPLSKHPFVMLRVADPRRIDGPTRACAAAAERIAAEQTADHANRPEHQREQHRQQNPRVQPAEGVADAAP